MLEELSQSANRVSSQAASVVETIRGSNRLIQAGEVFSQASGRLAAGSGEVAQGLARLGSIGQRLEHLLLFRRSLNHLMMTVRMLRVATRMETAALRHEDGLSMLANEIDKFSRRMDANVAGFFEQASAVTRETARLAAGLDTDRRAHQERLDEAERATRTALTQTTAIMERAASLSELTARRSGEVAREVGEIVASLQYHDITRQRIEHVLKAVEEAAESLRDRPGRRWGAARAGTSSAHHIIALQVSHLEHVKAQMQASGEQIIDSLTAISQGCRSQADGLAPLAGRDAGHDGLKALEEQAATLADSLARGSLLSRRMLEATGSAAELLGKMTGALTAVRDISEELGLLAMNALVKVSRQGEHGRALAEVAQEISRLSVEPRETVNQAAREVKALLSEAEEMGALHEAALSQHDSEAQARAAEAALQGLRGLRQEVHGAVSNLAGEAEGLAYQIGAVVRGVRFHHTAVARLGESIAILKECQGDLAAGGTHAAGPQPEPGRLETLAKHYTMESERMVHKAALERKAILEHKAPPAPRGQAAAPRKDAELGSNVELF
jgi:methyl-accepting chemotaxis protein